MIILVDGPEKSGKSTLIGALKVRLNATVVHFGPVDPDDRVYTEPLKVACASREWFIWDRGWPAEAVYGKLLNRDRRLAKDQFLGEWLHGRAVQTTGLRVILLPGRIEELRRRRDKTDLPVNPIDEYVEFAHYGQAFGYTMLTNDYTEEGLFKNVETVLARLRGTNVLTPPDYAGPIDAPVVFVGENRSNHARGSLPGQWLPFSSRLTTEVGRRIGPSALKFGWTNIGGVPLEFLANRYVVACGELAAQWLAGSGIARLVIPHPAWLYRYNNSKTYAKRDLVDKILRFIGDAKW